MFKDRVNYQKTPFPLTSVMTFTKFTARKYINVDKVEPNSNYRYHKFKILINIALIILQDIGATFNVNIYYIFFYNNFCAYRRNILKLMTTSRFNEHFCPPSVNGSIEAIPCFKTEVYSNWCWGLKSVPLSFSFCFFFFGFLF